MAWYQNNSFLRQYPKVIDRFYTPEGLHIALALKIQSNEVVLDCIYTLQFIVGRDIYERKDKGQIKKRDLIALLKLCLYDIF